MGAGEDRIPSGRAYLFSRGGPRGAYSALRYLLSRGHRGLVFSKTHPEKVATIYKIDCPIIWIVSHALRGEQVLTVNPQKLSRIYVLISDFVKNNPKAVVVLDGVELLISENDFQSVMKALQFINETVAMMGAILLLPTERGVITEQEFGFLEREMPSREPDVELFYL